MVKEMLAMLDFEADICSSGKEVMFVMVFSV